jgi:queuosine precursor transporter
MEPKKIEPVSNESLLYAGKQTKMLEPLSALFIVILIASNFIGASKVAEIQGFRFDSATLFFPISYVLGDIFTEVYGYARTRRVVWIGFGALLLTSLLTEVVLRLPAANDWPNQAAFETVFGTSYRVVAGSLLGFWAGEIVNSYVLAKLKVKTAGRYLWLRTIGSTIFGEAVDSIFFYPIAFFGIWKTEMLIQVMATNYVFKVLWEAAMTPATYWIVGKLKRIEGEDFYDKTTHFNPFQWRINS